MNILEYKRSNKVYFDSLENGDVFIYDNKIYMKVSNKMRSQDGGSLVTIYCSVNVGYDFGVNLETGESRGITGGTWVEPLDEVKIRKE